MSSLRHLGAASVWLTAAVIITFSACDAAEETAATKCDSGTNVFCRCPGGDPGTRECLNDGSNFGECVIAPGVPCGDRFECVEGDRVFCVCPDGTSGEKECLRDGSSYGECKLEDGTPCPDEGTTTTTTTTSSGTGGGGTGGGGTSAGCDHDECETGDPLGPNCTTCTAAVCAADSYCCETKWDLFCLAVVDQECDSLCTGPSECAHDPCEQGDALDPACDPCVTEVCATDADCCDGGTWYWDDVCVAAANNPTANPACAGTCGCDHDECVTGVKLDATCSECATAVCAFDPICCNTEWDDYCVAWAEDEPTCNCPIQT